jgi:hypothetical protein
MHFTSHSICSPHKLVFGQGPRKRQQYKQKATMPQYQELHVIADQNSKAISMLKQGDCQRAKDILLCALTHLQEYAVNCDEDDDEEDDASMNAEDIGQPNMQDSFICFQWFSAMFAPSTHMVGGSQSQTQTPRSSMYNRTWQIPSGSKDPAHCAAAILFNLGLIYHRVAVFTSTPEERTRAPQEALRCYRDAHGLLQDNPADTLPWVQFLRSAILVNMMYVYSTTGDSTPLFLLWNELQHVQAHLSQSLGRISIESMQQSFIEGRVHDDIATLEEAMLALHVRV